MKQWQKYLISLPIVVQNQILTIVWLLIAWNYENQDIKKLQWEKNFYRCRVWKLRIIYSLIWNDIIIKYIWPRGDIYK